MALRLLELLDAHLCQGRLSPGGQLRLAEMDELCPASCRPRAATLWRAVMLAVDEHDILRSGGTVELEPRRHDCWSASATAVRGLLRTRADQDPHRPVPAILKRDFIEPDLAVDTEALARHLGLDGAGAAPAWHRYAGREREVLVRNPGGRVLIHPSELAFSWRGEIRASIWLPVIGESFTDEDGCDRLIETFLGGDAEGNMLVGSGGRTFALEDDNGGWTATCSSIEHAQDPSPE